MRAETSSRRSAPPAGADNTAIVGKRVVVMGLGRFGGGVGVARWLAGGGASVLVTDLADSEALKSSVEALAGSGVAFRLGGHRTDDLLDADLLVVSPAVVKERSDFFQHALLLNIPWTTEINLFVERCPARIVGVTGTVGKSTTAAMIHAILCAGRGADRCYLGGNIGGSLLDAVDRMTADDVVVLELSSFQLSDLVHIDRRPDLAVIMPVQPNHLDRHGSFEAYLDAKLNIARGSAPRTPVVLADDDARLRSAVQQVAPDAVVHFADDSSSAKGLSLCIPGAHNRQNARVAAKVASLLGVDESAIRVGLAGFPGLAHRLQFVGTFGGADYYNDSKATSPQATITALRSFDRPVIVLVGGKANDATCGELASVIVASARAVVAFGQAGPTISQAVARATNGDARIEPRCVATMADAVAIAKAIAEPGDVVLLSPGFPSYDEFANYEQRGDAFVTLVRGCDKT